MGWGVEGMRGGRGAGDYVHSFLSLLWATGRTVSFLFEKKEKSPGLIIIKKINHTDTYFPRRLATVSTKNVHGDPSLLKEPFNIREGLYWRRKIDG